jgi:thiol:disulfide interchange protein
MAPSEPDVVSAPRTKPNPEGRVVEVDELELDKIIRQGPVLVDFYAPWCGQ